MTNQLYRVVFDDSAVELKTKPAAVELEGEQLASLTEMLSVCQVEGVELVAVEKVTVAPDFDMEDSTKWMANLDVTMILRADDTTAKLLDPFELVPDQFQAIKTFLDKVVDTLTLEKLPYSGEWVVIEMDNSNDYEAETSLKV